LTINELSARNAGGEASLACPLIPQNLSSVHIALFAWMIGEAVLLSWESPSSAKQCSLEDVQPGYSSLQSCTLQDRQGDAQPRTITKELLGQNHMVTVAVFFSEAFLRDAAILYCLLHHLFSKN
jgi:hypothetical protein